MFRQICSAITSRFCFFQGKNHNESTLCIDHYDEQEKSNRTWTEHYGTNMKWRQNHRWWAYTMSKKSPMEHEWNKDETRWAFTINGDESHYGLCPVQRVLWIGCLVMLLQTVFSTGGNFEGSSKAAWTIFEKTANLLNYGFPLCFILEKNWLYLFKAFLDPQHFLEAYTQTLESISVYCKIWLAERRNDQLSKEYFN